MTVARSDAVLDQALFTCRRAETSAQITKTPIPITIIAQKDAISMAIDATRRRPRPPTTPARAARYG